MARAFGNSQAKRFLFAHRVNQCVLDQLVCDGHESMLFDRAAVEMHSIEFAAIRKLAKAKSAFYLPNPPKNEQEQLTLEMAIQRMKQKESLNG